MIKIYGSSDDLVEVEGSFTEEYSTTYEDVCLAVVGSEGGIDVTMTYESNGTWSAKLTLWAEDLPFPWPITVGLHEKGYSAEVIIDCPDTGVNVIRRAQ